MIVSGYASGSLLFPTSSEAQDINDDEDNLSVIGLGELSDRAQEEQASRRSNDTADNSSSDLATSSGQANIPGGSYIFVIDMHSGVCVWGGGGGRVSLFKVIHFIELLVCLIIFNVHSCDKLSRCS